MIPEEVKEEESEVKVDKKPSHNKGFKQPPAKRLKKNDQE